MTRRIAILIVFLPLAFAGCGGKEEPKAEQAKAAAPRAAVQEQEAPVQAPPQVSQDKKAMRNPFSSYLAKQVTKTERMKTPLECCDLMTFRVVAVLSSAKGNYALIQVPDGKRYKVGKGDRMGLRDGTIVEISDSTIIVEEVERDPEDNIVARQRTELSLPKEKQDEAQKK